MVGLGSSPELWGAMAAQISTPTTTRTQSREFSATIVPEDA